MAGLIMRGRAPSRVVVDKLPQRLPLQVGYPGLWNPTAVECARYWLETYPASAHLRLAPGIWQDYPGSLS
jgi:hypothetical protein